MYALTSLRSKSMLPEDRLMTRRFVDLSILLENDVVTDLPFMRPKITYQTHQETLKEARHFSPD